LISLGLVAKDKGKVPPASPIHYYDESDDSEYSFFDRSVGELVYTQAGQALCRSIRVPKVEGFFNKVCIPFWRKETEKQKKELEERVREIKIEMFQGDRKEVEEAFNRWQEQEVESAE
ncbi:MAG: hypothetical protein IJP07_06815, partial [Firmicutes bacterium]|nr:hypothetical protein [Bacillota bacterium]